ncbi:MAG: type II secretion system F family protein [Candidatus Nomurabacteria bacterium]|jgi:type IV pilus assembly protein PilC|nr:type II secretion system F family protein [Candidatus Nomurabacteria bacterium]
MQTFKYTARDTATNKIVHSTVQASSEAEAAKLLMAQNIVPTEMSVVNGKGGISFGSRVPTKARVIFTRQLATMINAGLPLSQSLSTVRDQTANKNLKNIITEIANSVSGGAALGDSFAKYPKVFNQVYIALVRAGEASGTLDKSLERLADQQEHDADMLSKIRGAMVYPAIVLAVIVGVIIFMLVTLVPQVEMLYSDMGKELPLQTQILNWVANFVINYWYIVILVIIGLVFLLKWWIQTESGRKTWDTIKLNMPLFSSLFRKMYMARFTRTSETLLAAGVPMLEVLRISADSVNNVVVKEAIIRAARKVKNGKPLSEGLTGEDYILPFVPQMIKIGETSGGIDAMMGKVADFYEKEVDNAIKSISTLIEPILMVCMAFMIGFIVLAVLLPIYEIAGM